MLPGVTVEAASPALIEKVRVGSYRRTGQYPHRRSPARRYTVPSRCTGFAPCSREGIELTASFTATVNAEMRVGSLEETITVTGETPTVDVQNVTQQQVMTRDVIDNIPVGTSARRRSASWSRASRRRQDVGGTQYGSAAIAVHGSRVQEQQLVYDGM